MIKRNWKLLVLTTLIILIPILVGLFLWNDLPEQIPTHWNIDGEVDGWSSKAFAVFGLPLFLAAVHWLCFLATSADPKVDNINSKVLILVLWICPAVSLLMMALVYPTALGYETILSTPTFMTLFFGAIFLFIGNYLPKCKQSYTVGIKLPWTLNNEENWNKTHRFGGWVWTIGGAVVMVSSFIGSVWLVLPIVVIMVLAPAVYSYLLYRGHKQSEG